MIRKCYFHLQSYVRPNNCGSLPGDSATTIIVSNHTYAGLILGLHQTNEVPPSLIGLAQNMESALRMQIFRVSIIIFHLLSFK